MLAVLPLEATLRGLELCGVERVAFVRGDVSEKGLRC
jgi:hypothetical protein